MARSQIRRTGDRGRGLALAGLILGWLAIISFVLLVVAGSFAFVRMGHTVMSAHVHAGPPPPVRAELLPARAVPPVPGR